MNSFTFGRPVEIDGQIYYITGDTEKIAQELQVCKAKINLINEDESLSAEKQKELVKESAEKAVDTILGEGSFSKIFQDRNFNYNDLIDLIIFFTKEIAAWAEERREA